MTNKIIILDWSIFMFRAIFAWRKNKQIPPEYTALNMIISCLRRIGIEPTDEIIVACDGRGNWRKEIEGEYKANRKAFRDSFTDVDWNDMFNKFDILLENVNRGTDWQIIQIAKIEADDIASVACRYFKDKELILISYDSDWQMLWHYPNVKIFSPILKPKGYKVPPKNFNVYQFLAKKIKKEVTDNLVNPILNKQDYEKREQVVSLLKLPEFVENAVIAKFQALEEKDSDLECVPYQKMRDKIGNLYNDKSEVIDYEKWKNKKPRKKRRRKKNVIH